MSDLMLAFFFFNDTATTEIYTLSLHDALPIWESSNIRATPDGAYSSRRSRYSRSWPSATCWCTTRTIRFRTWWSRSEEHTSELQSQSNLVCRLLLEKKKKNTSCRLSNASYRLV